MTCTGNGESARDIWFDADYWEEKPEVIEMVEKTGVEFAFNCLVRALY